MRERLRQPITTDIRILIIARLVCVAAAIIAMFSQVAVSQTLSTPPATEASSNQPSFESICTDPPQDSAKAAMRLVCERGPLEYGQPLPLQTIVIGFVGGFANPQDVKHPEILFAAFLHRHYAPQLHARVFSNHDRKSALHYVLGLLDTNGDGFLSDEEKKSAQIIIYGHSWGASETVAFATTLQHYSVPVLLTVQLDTVSKWGQKPSRIPSNVESAINFFQSEGLLRGRPEIVAADRTRTEIIGNLRFTYLDKPVNCDNYPWLARTFNKPHHEIENDPGVWDQIASLIDSKISRSRHAKNLPPNIDTKNDEGVSRTTSQPGSVNPMSATGQGRGFIADNPF
jgi:pimeloyl-ACP methyl ester carboxylesterase